MTVLIRASELQTLNYCEYQLFLSNNTFLPNFSKPELSNERVKGIQAHKLIDEKFLNRSKGKISLLQFLTENKKRFRTRPDACGVMLVWENDGYRLVGRLDEIISSFAGIFIVENKASTYAYVGMKNQTRSYCLLLKKNFEKEIGQKNIYGLLKSTRTGKFFWKELFGVQEERIILEELERIKQIKLGQLNPQKVNGNKCNYCQWKEKCKKLA